MADFRAIVAGIIGQALHRDKSVRRPEDVEPTEMARPLAIPHKADLGSLVGTSNAMISVLEQSLQVAPTKTNVLIRGESGTGCA
jgi:DNA-binding NtrC family response regulator